MSWHVPRILHEFRHFPRIVSLMLFLIQSVKDDPLGTAVYCPCFLLYFYLLQRVFLVYFISRSESEMGWYVWMGE